ncbi:MAG: hypothetical protein S4CHLAM45_15410 [Chlamydiales bacterium]|nr:hypothetical protein [Chlamydiales bacterium]MCH9620158.1 hypothetical protein [Chlamydiales bacterium]MCH9623628.1 hypothetical protein [Chlamydiales bacterium]
MTLLIICCFFQSLFSSPQKPVAEVNTQFHDRVMPKVARFVRAVEVEQKPITQISYLIDSEPFLAALDATYFVGSRKKLIEAVYDYLRNNYTDDQLDEVVALFSKM